jgi:hypothetical protein
MRIGTHSFLLQNFFVEEWAANFMMHALVTNLDDGGSISPLSISPDVTACRARRRRSWNRGA